MKEYQTLKTLQQNILKILLEHPEWGDLPLISSSDDEGNDYHKVYNDLSPAQVENIKNYSLELVGFEGEEDVDTKDINCICIN